MVTAAVVGIVAMQKAGQDPAKASPTAEGNCPHTHPVRGVTAYDPGSVAFTYRYQLPPADGVPSQGWLPARICFASPMEAAADGYGRDAAEIGREGGLERQRSCVTSTLAAALQFNAGEANEVELADRLRAATVPGDFSVAAFPAVVSSFPQEAWPLPQMTDLMQPVDHACIDQARAAGMPTVRSLR